MSDTIYVAVIVHPDDAGTLSSQHRCDPVIGLQVITSKHVARGKVWRLTAAMYRLLYPHNPIGGAR